MFTMKRAYQKSCFWKLTFDIHFHKSGFRHAQSILCHTLVCSCRATSDRADCDFSIRAENAVDTFLFPPNLCWWIALWHTPHCHWILFLLKVCQRSGFRNDIWWIWKRNGCYEMGFACSLSNWDKNFLAHYDEGVTRALSYWKQRPDGWHRMVTDALCRAGNRWLWWYQSFEIRFLKNTGNNAITVVMKL